MTSNKTYWPITLACKMQELIAHGHRVSKERARQLMQLHDIRVWCKDKFVVKSDITYIATDRDGCT